MLTDEIAWSEGDDFDLLPPVAPDADGSYPMPSGLVGIRVQALGPGQPPEELWKVELLRPGSSVPVLHYVQHARARYFWRADLHGKIIGPTKLAVTGASVEFEVKAKSLP